MALTPQKVRGGRSTGYGLGWVLGRRGTRREAYHVGGQPQVSTVVYMLPEAGVAVAILADLEGVENGLLDAGPPGGGPGRGPVGPPPFRPKTGPLPGRAAVVTCWAAGGRACTS